MPTEQRSADARGAELAAGPWCRPPMTVKRWKWPHGRAEIAPRHVGRRSPVLGRFGGRCVWRGGEGLGDRRADGHSRSGCGHRGNPGQSVSGRPSGCVLLEPALRRHARSGPGGRCLRHRRLQRVHAQAGAVGAARGGGGAVLEGGPQDHRRPPGPLPGALLRLGLSGRDGVEFHQRAWLLRNCHRVGCAHDAAGTAYRPGGRRAGRRHGAGAGGRGRLVDHAAVGTGSAGRGRMGDRTVEAGAVGSQS